MSSNRLGGTDDDSILQSLLTLWLVNVLLAPLLALFGEAGKFLDELINGKPLARMLDDQVAALTQWDIHERRHLARLARIMPPFSRRLIGLGAFSTAKTDAFPDSSGVVRMQRWLGITEQVLDHHFFILGAPGAGKSETIKRIIHDVLTNTNRDVIFVDGKGEQSLALAIRALAYHAGRGEAPIFRMGFARPGARYNPFCGDKEAIYSRLVAMAGLAKLEGNADIYGRITREVLQLICYASKGPPRSFEELRTRLTLQWLTETYKDHPFEGEVVKDKDFKARLEGVQQRLRPLIREFAQLSGSDGFVLEQSRTAIFSIRTQSVSDTSSYFLQVLIDDLLDYIGKRQERPALLVIDEFGAFGNDNIVKLLALARSSHLGIVLATQDVAYLGDEATARLILANTGTKILMRSDYPEDIAKLAGTSYELEAGMQFDQGKATGLGTVRPQHTFKIDMNEAAQLGIGEAFLIRHRRTAKLSIAALNEQDVLAKLETTPPEPEPTPDAMTHKPVNNPRRKKTPSKNID